MEKRTFLAAERDDGLGVEAAVGPHRELSCGPGVAHPSHRLTQEVGGAPRRVGPALPETGHQHVGAGGDGQQRVIAPLSGVDGALPPSSRRWWSPGRWSTVRRRVRPHGPGTGQHSRLTRSSWRTWPHRKLRRKVPRVDGALTTQPMAPAVPPVRNTSASSMQSPPASAGHQRHHLVAGVGTTQCLAQVQMTVNQLGQAQV